MSDEEELTRSQILLAKLRDERCGGNAAELARRIKKDPTYVNSLFYPRGKKGAKGIGLEVMRAASEAFQLPPGYWEGADAGQLTEEAPYLPGFENVSVPVLATGASMGPGNEQHDDVVVGRLTLSPQWITKTLKPSAPENLRFIHGYGDSMEGTFNDGDILLVDAGIRNADIDGIYVLEANQRIFVKRVTERFDGKHEITSDNPKVKTVQLLDGSEQVNILGRVIWAWNGKKL